MKILRYVVALGAGVSMLAACSTPTVPGAENNGAATGAPAATRAGGARDGGGTASRLQAVKKAGELRVCTTGDYRPFTYKDFGNGNYSGIDITMAEDLGKRLGVKVTYVPTTWKNLMGDFLGRCDIAMGGVSISLERAEQAAFSDPTLTEGKTPITKCGSETRYDTVDEINQPTVRSITPVGGTNEKFATRYYPKGQVIRWEDNNTIFDQILAGKADVMTTDASETKWIQHTKPGLCAVHPDQPFDFSQKAYLLPQGDETFRQYVNLWLRGAMNDGTMAAAQKAWFG